MSVVDTNRMYVHGGQQSVGGAVSVVSAIKIYTHRDEIDTYLWNELLQHSDHASFFQSPTCYDLYAQQDFMEPFVVAVANGQQLTALVCGYITSEGKGIKSYMSRRAIVPGGLLIRNGANSNVITELLQTLNVLLKRRCIYTEIRNYADYSLWKQNCKVNGYRYQSHLNIQIDCTCRDIVWDGLSESKRRQIKQSIQAGLYIEKAQTTEEVKEFYGILSDLYSRKIHRPLFPEQFFQSLLQKKDVVILLCKYNDKVCGGIVCVSYEKDSISEWFVCGKDKMGIKGAFPSVLSTWAGIEYAIEHDYRIFDFMGAGKPDEAYGVRDFKMRFGGELVEYGRFLYIRNQFLFRTAAFSLLVLKKLLFINKTEKV